MKAILSIALLMCLAMFYSYSDALRECPIPNEQYVTLLPHPDNCNHYFACESGEPIPMKCPEGLHFNEELSVCDWPWRANCKAAVKH